MAIWLCSEVSQRRGDDLHTYLISAKPWAVNMDKPPTSQSDTSPRFQFTPNIPLPILGRKLINLQEMAHVLTSIYWNKPLGSEL